MKKKNLKLLKVRKQRISQLNPEEVKGGTGNLLSFVPGVYCSAGATSSFGEYYCQYACLCVNEEN
jgi:hypothetical protein